MNETFSDIGKKLPYTEAPEYLDSLIDKVTEAAITRQHGHRDSRRMRRMAMSAAAGALLLIAIGFTVYHQQARPAAAVTVQADGPLDEFLNTLSAQELSQLQYYEIEEIPEY